MSGRTRGGGSGERFGGLHLAWSKLLLRGFASAGVRAVFVSPGSRSTPLALAAYEERGLETRVIVDERAAGFAALGHARVTGSPAVVLCTSGTAPAHYYPALLEAEQSRIPLVVVSADRPLELAGVGAPQTIDQAKLFGDHVRAFFELGAPEVEALELPLRVAAHAVLAATSPVAGPVHVNARFRKPLEPVEVDESRFADRARALLEAGAPRALGAWVAPSATSVAHVASRVRAASGVIVVAGPARGPSGGPVEARDAALTAAVTRFAEHAGAAVIAEVTSGIALARAGAFASLDALVQAGAIDGDPGLICLEIGSPAVASRYQAWAARQPGSRRLVVTESGWPDPFGGLADVVHGEPASLLAAVADALAQDGGPTALREARDARRAHVKRASVRLLEGARALCEAPPLGEPGVAAIVANAVPPGSTLVVGNSLAVRDLDAFAAHLLDGVTVLHQRGVSGIDGLLAGAVGTRWAVDPTRPVALLYGDVSALHDVGSLALLRDVEGPLAVIVVDNGGGRIFEELPIARVPHLEGAMRDLFLTPPPPFLEGVARAFGVAFERAHDASSLRASLARALASPRPTVVEVCVEPVVGSKSRRALAELAAAETTR